jgi:hypothetical protein
MKKEEKQLKLFDDDELKMNFEFSTWLNEFCTKYSHYLGGKKNAAIIHMDLINVFHQMINCKDITKNFYNYFMEDE